jgi:hypothetical protein
MNAFKPIMHFQVSMLRMWADNIERFAGNYQQGFEETATVVEEQSKKGSAQRKTTVRPRHGARFEQQPWALTMRRRPPVKLFAAVSQFIHRRRPQTSAAQAPFDDGLVDIARLIEVDDPPDVAPHPAADTVEPLQQNTPLERKR